MNAKTRMSAKGQVVIPKDVRDHLGLKPGQTLEVIETHGGVLLRVSKGKGQSTEEILLRMGERSKRHITRTVSIEEIDAAALEAWGNTKTARTGC